MPASPDLACQWCKKTVAVAIGDTEGSWINVAQTVEYGGKFYCDGESGKCWDNLIALTKFVRDNFSD